MNSETCTFCGQSAPLLFQVGDLNRRLSPAVFGYYRCPNCRLIFLAPHPADLGIYYPSDYYGKTRTLDDISYEIDAERYKIELVHRFAKSGRLLEIGPSRGAFAHLAKQGGFQVSAIERDVECCRFLTEVIGVEAINEIDPASALDRLEPFDVIALWQVIEHLDAPWKFIRAAASKLKPGGYLFIGAPNPDSLQFRLFGRYWAHLDAPRHLQLIPAALLKQLGAEVGLQEVMLNTSGDGELDRNNQFSWEWSSAHVFGKQKWGSWMALNTSRIAYHLRRYEQEDLRGCTYTLVLHKPA